MRGWLWALLLGVSGAGFFPAMGCGGDETGAGGAGAAPGATVGSSSTVASSSSGSVSDGNDTFETAEPVSVDTSYDGDLSPTGDVDVYKLSGTKKQALYIATKAQGPDFAFDPETINTVITLHGADGVQIAANNDRSPLRSRDSELFTILPSDGVYFIKVWECSTWTKFPNVHCGEGADSPDKVNTSYTLTIFEVPSKADGTSKDAEDPSGPTPLTYNPEPNGGYFLSLVWGEFKDQSDVDSFVFTPPADAVKSGEGRRTHANFYILPSGLHGNGSTTPPGRVWITDPNAPDPTKAIAAVFGPNYQEPAELTPPLPLGQQYQIWIEHPDGPAGANDFYFVLHSLGWGNLLEKDDAGNDAPATAEVLTASPTEPTSYYIEGDLDLSKQPNPDVDHFKAAVKGKKVNFACGALRDGSGLVDLKVDLLHGMTLITSMTELVKEDAVSEIVGVPSGATDLVLKVSAESQAPDIASSFYRCGLHFYDTE